GDRAVMIGRRRDSRARARTSTATCRAARGSWSHRFDRCATRIVDCPRSIERQSFLLRVSTLTHKQKIQLAVGGLLALALLALFLRGQKWSEIGAAFAHAHVGYLAGLMAATIVAYLVRASRWGLLYRPLAPVPYADLLSATYVGFMSALFVPRSGEVLRPYLI